MAQAAVCYRTRNIARPIRIRTSTDYQQIGVVSLRHQHLGGVTFRELQLPPWLRNYLLEDAVDAAPVRGAYLLLREPTVFTDLNRSEGLDTDRPIDHMHRAYRGSSEAGLSRRPPQGRPRRRRVVKPNHNPCAHILHSCDPAR
jgi:hypothetical protein